MATRYTLTKEKVLQAQQHWGDGIVKIGAVYTDNGDYTAAAKEHIDKLYAYDQSPVLFKPTKAAIEPFRGNKDSALSYFVATNGVCSEDSGFAINPWTKVRFENDDIILHGDTALAMGIYYFTDSDGQETKVEYTFGYLMDHEGNVRINLHHSSLPYSA